MPTLYANHFLKYFRAASRLDTFCTYCIIMTQIKIWIWHGSVLLFHHFHIFNKINSLPKDIWNNVFLSRKVDYIFEELSNLHLIDFGDSFFSIIPHKIEPSWRNFLIWTTNWGGRQLLEFIDCTKCFLSNCSNAIHILN